MCLTENSTLECVGSSCQVVVAIAVVAIVSSFATLIGHLLSALYAGARNMPRPATDVVQFLASSTAKAKGGLPNSLSTSVSLSAAESTRLGRCTAHGVWTTR